METNEIGLLSECSSRHVDAVLPDEALASAGNSATARVLSELSWVTSKLSLHTGSSGGVGAGTGLSVLHIHFIAIICVQAYLSIIITNTKHSHFEIFPINLF